MGDHRHDNTLSLCSSHSLLYTIPHHTKAILLSSFLQSWVGVYQALEVPECELIWWWDNSRKYFQNLDYLSRLSFFIPSLDNLLNVSKQIRKICKFSSLEMESFFAPNA